MEEFSRKFFGYYRYQDETGILGIPEPFKDGLGKGAFSDYRHFIWMFLVIVFSIGLYKLFKKHKVRGGKTVLILAIYMFSVRLVNQIVRAIIGAEVPAWRAFPFHLCTMMSFVLPLVVVFNLKKFKLPIYTLSIMGGVITIFLGEYFDNGFLTFAALEGMITHTLLVLIPLIELATNKYQFLFKKMWQVFVAIIILMLWATLANNVFFKNYDTNYMYLKANGLPGNLGGDYYFLIYAALFIVMNFIIFGIPVLHRKLVGCKN